MEVPTHVVPELVSLDVKLEWLISATGLRATTAAGRRLNALENVLTNLARRWRDHLVPIRPAVELRMSEDTCLRLLAWADAEGTGDPKTLDRLTTYASGALTDEGVPTGWVRLRVVDLLRD